MGQMSDQMKVTVPNLDGSTTALGAESVDALELLSLNEQIREEFVVAAQLKQEQELKGEEITNSGQHSVQPSRPVEILLFRALQAEREKKSNP